MSQTLFLIACSSAKTCHRIGPAKRIYNGALLHLCLRLARVKGWEPLILSGRYGFITPDTVIETYNHKIYSRFKGKWPAGRGYFLGGKKYFEGCPPSFKSLLDPKLSYGERQREIHKMIRKSKKGLL